MVVRRKEKPALVAIEKMLKHDIREHSRLLKIVRVERSLINVHKRTGQQRIIFQIGIETSDSVLEGTLERPPIPHLSQDKVDGVSRCIQVTGVMMRAEALRECGGHHRVPRSQDFLVTSRMHSLLARGEKLLTNRGNRILNFRLRLFEHSRRIRDVQRAMK